LRAQSPLRAQSATRPGGKKHDVHLGAGKGLRARPGFVKGNDESGEIDQNSRN
jgi:hypothetical protein